MLQLWGYHFLRPRPERDCRMLQCVAVHYSVLQYVLQYVAVHCSMLQYFAEAGCPLLRLVFVVNLFTNCMIFLFLNTDAVDNDVISAAMLIIVMSF